MKKAELESLCIEKGEIIEQLNKVLEIDNDLIRLQNRLIKLNELEREFMNEDIKAYKTIIFVQDIIVIIMIITAVMTFAAMKG